MDKVELVRKAYTFGKPEESMAYFSDDFKATDETGGPALDKASWFGMGELMRAAIPDIYYVFEDIHEEGDKVILTGYFSGTFKNDFDLSSFGMDVIAATGKAVTFPSSTIEVSLDGDKISRSHSVATGPDAGLEGFLKALTV